MPHVNARTNVYGRSLAVQRYLAGHKVGEIAGQLGISRTTVYKWIARFRAEGSAGLADRSSRPRTSPRRTPLRVELAILAARLDQHAGPVQLAAGLGVPASTVGAVLRRWAMPHLVDLDRITGELLRSRATDARYEHPRPGDLLHVDVKKLGRIPDGGGWRLDGANATDRSRSRHQPAGFDYIHVAVDDHSRVAYAEIHPDEKATTCAAFLHRAVSWFRDQHGVTVRRVLTDNAKSYRTSQDWTWVCHALQLKRRFIKPGCPWTNGKAERFNRTLLTDWAYARAWYSTTSATPPLTPSSTATTITADTPQPAVDHRSPASQHDPRQQRPGSGQLEPRWVDAAESAVDAVCGVPTEGGVHGDEALVCPISAGCNSCRGGTGSVGARFSCTGW